MFRDFCWNNRFSRMSVSALHFCIRVNLGYISYARNNRFQSNSQTRCSMHVYWKDFLHSIAFYSVDLNDFCIGRNTFQQPIFDREQCSKVLEEALLLLFLFLFLFLLLAWNHSETNEICSQCNKTCSYKMLDKH